MGGRDCLLCSFSPPRERRGSGEAMTGLACPTANEQCYPRGVDMKG